MAPTRGTTSLHELQIGLIRAAIVVTVIVAVILAGAAAFGWTLPAAPSFDLTLNPGIDLP